MADFEIIKAYVGLDIRPTIDNVLNQLKALRAQVAALRINVAIGQTGSGLTQAVTQSSQISANLQQAAINSKNIQPPRFPFPRPPVTGQRTNVQNIAEQVRDSGLLLRALLPYSRLLDRILLINYAITSQVGKQNSLWRRVLSNNQSVSKVMLALELAGNAFTRSLSKSAKAGLGIAESLKKAGAAASSAASLVNGLGAAVLAVVKPLAVLVGLIAAVTAAIKSIPRGARIEELAFKFTALTGSLKETIRFFEAIDRVDVKSPFTRDELLPAARTLLESLKGDVTKAGEDLERLVDIAFVSPQSNLNEIAVGFRKVRQQGRVTLEFLEILSNRTQITDELAKTIGVTTSGLLDSISRGEVTVNQFERALVSLSAKIRPLREAAADNTILGLVRGIGTELGRLLEWTGLLLADFFGIRKDLQFMRDVLGLLNKGLRFLVPIESLLPTALEKAAEASAKIRQSMMDSAEAVEEMRDNIASIRTLEEFANLVSTAPSKIEALQVKLDRTLDLKQLQQQQLMTHTMLRGLDGVQRAVYNQTGQIPKRQERGFFDWSFIGRRSPGFFSDFIQ